MYNESRRNPRTVLRRTKLLQQLFLINGANALIGIGSLAHKNCHPFCKKALVQQS